LPVACWGVSPSALTVFVVVWPARWRFDPTETEKLMKQYGTPQDKIETRISPSQFGIKGKFFSPERFEDLRDGYLDVDRDIQGIERSVKWFTIQVLIYLKYGEPAKGTDEYWCDGKLLVSTFEDEAWAYTRVEDSYRKGDISPEQKQHEAEMDAWSTRKKELMAELDKKLKAEHEKRVARERQLQDQPKAVGFNASRASLAKGVN
jgi:hypothetical protein